MSDEFHAEQEERDRLKQIADNLGHKLDMRQKTEKLREEVMKLRQEEAANRAPPEDNAQKNKDLDWMQRHAEKIFRGQSVSLPMGERVSRIRAALKDHGFKSSEIEKVELPTKEEYKRYL